MKYNTTGLTKKQKNQLKQHSSHHTPKHMAAMVKLMKSGFSFTVSHELVKNKIGK